MKQLRELADEQLVSLYQEGNNSAFDTLLKRYQQKVFSYLLYSVKNQELAEDLFQDVFMKIVVRIKNRQYAENGKFSSWMMRIVHNHLIDYYRTCPTERIISNDESDVDLFNVAIVCLNSFSIKAVEPVMLCVANSPLTVEPSLSNAVADKAAISMKCLFMHRSPDRRT